MSDTVSVENVSSAETLTTDGPAPKINQIGNNALLVSSEKVKIKVVSEILPLKVWTPKENAEGAKSIGKSTGKEENPPNLSSPAHLPPSKGLVFADLSTKSDHAAKMAAFDVIKKSLETMEKNVKISKKLLEDRVNSLDEMKRNRQEAETEGEKRELKIAIEALEEIIGNYGEKCESEQRHAWK